MKRSLSQASPMAEAFCKLLHPWAEVVIHDIEHNQIAAIFNPMSHRQVGDASYIEQWDFQANTSTDVIGPYQKINHDGQAMKSISVVLRNEQGSAEGFLCVNMDVSVFERYQQSLQLFLGNNNPESSQPYDELFKDDLYEQINIFVQEFCRNNQLNMNKLNRKHKKEIINDLKQKGALTGKNASQYAARVLGVSRATIYNYLK